ncbi:MAG: hypothetical protein WA208_10210 [Thermoanaerobaculia bacterium]
MRISSVLGTFVFLTATAAVAAPPLGDDCKHAADRKVATPATGISKIVIHGEAGSLRVEGRDGAVDVAAVGRACTSDRDLLDDMTLTLRRSGNTLHVDAHIPEKTIIFGFYEARLDFTVLLPANIPVEIHDGSGSLKVANVVSAVVEDGSGSMEIRGVRGALQISDGSGEIDIDGIGGNVTIEDGSGEITLRNATGNVTIEDGSGGIDVARIGGRLVIDDSSGSISAAHVKQGVIVEDDGSGSIDVADIGGDFLVHQKGSGSVHHTRVAGKVSVPRD